jgi:branched-chain amino acid transport system permease protein
LPRVSALAARIPSREQVGSYLTWRRLPVLLAAGLVLFVLVYILFLATIPGSNGATNWRTTTFGSAYHDPSSFLRVVIDSLTFASALFIVASGFALIFGLMRTVNMAHGALYLLAGYIAYEVQQKMNGSPGISLDPTQVTTWEWLVPLLIAAPIIMVIGR